MSNIDRNRILTQLDAIEADGHEASLRLDSRTILPVSHLNKLFFPHDITKGDVMRYYVWMSPYILPLLEDRALALKRFPNGVTGKSFFQQKAPPSPPQGVRVATLTSESGDTQARLIGGSLATLLYCVQLGTIECNPWNARVRSLEYLDYIVIDLDPGPNVSFDRVVEATLWVKDALDTLGLHAAVKTSGVSGMHIFIPLPPKTSEAIAESVSTRVAHLVAKAHPREATTQRAISDRKGTQIYIDAGQNSRGKTVAAAYSVRATPDAKVSTPISWDELTPGFAPDRFTLLTLPDRLATVGDLWGPVMGSPNTLPPVTES